MLVYTGIFENTKVIGSNFPIEDVIYATSNEAIVVDGITRDPVGISNLATCSFKEMLEKYPRPSGAWLAAKKIADTFSNTNSDCDLTKRIEKCNDAVRLLNKQYILKCDYLQNDYFGAVLSCIHIENDILNYAFICDCGVIVYDTFGKVKFKTEDEKELYSDPYINKINASWNEPSTRVIVRRDYRNNLKNIQDGKCASYGAITGEEAALNFVRSGSIKLTTGDIIVVYSDGLVNFLKEKKFIELLLNFNKEKFEEYINKQSHINYEKYGKEKSMVIYLFN